MKNNFCIIILAAGKGTRMKLRSQKVFQEVAGLPILGHVIKSAKLSNAQQIVTVLPPNGNLEKLPPNCKTVEIAYQNNAKGSGDAVLQALPYVRTDTVLVLYGDTPLITESTIKNVIEKFENSGSDISVMTINEQGDSNFGRLVIDENNQVQKIVESCDKNEQTKCSNLCNVGIVFKKNIAEKILPNIPENNIKHEVFLTDMIEYAYNQGHKISYVICNHEEMYGINTIKDLTKVESIFQQKMREKFMSSGVKLISPETVFFSYDTEIEPDVTIHPYVVFGLGVKVKSYSTIYSFSHLEGVNVDGAQIGPFARIRPETTIESGSKIGNFVEIKNSLIKSGSKVNHLSYIGDSEVGEDTNIGAGTITCNYDGFEKHKTRIGKEVFVGSNSCLVAPVEIDDGALIGAGSVVVNSVKKYDLCISRAEQKNMPDAAKKFREKRKKCAE